ncbi:hypothetical protein [Nafulsella turpanensis]|uniref:hypothetical protein n=1 Tax=Nafulsella turpanensis TaxID=1265690 RepID=UPI001269364E|nr:hypothetical protein [Nafulsella turpanensis]
MKLFFNECDKGKEGTHEYLVMGISFTRCGMGSRLGSRAFSQTFKEVKKIVGLWLAVQPQVRK